MGEGKCREVNVIVIAVGLTLPVRKKKLKMSDEHVYRISWKFIGFAVFLDKILGKIIKLYTK